MVDNNDLISMVKETLKAGESGKEFTLEDEKSGKVEVGKFVKFENAGDFLSALQSQIDKFNALNHAKVEDIEVKTCGDCQDHSSAE